MSDCSGTPMVDRLSTVSLIRSADVWEHAHRLPGWTVEYEQLSAGRFEGTLTHIQLNHMQIMRDKANVALLKRGQAFPDAVVFSLPVSAAGDGRYVGQPLCPPSFLLSNGNDLPELCTPSALDLICVAIDRPWLVERALTLGYDLTARRSLLNSRLMMIPEPAMQQLHTMFTAIFDDLAALSTALSHVSSRHALENALAETLLSVLCSDEEPVGQYQIATPYKRIADKARIFALTAVGQQPTIPDICSHLGISRRKLQICFQESYGFSPNQFLRILRLNGVRDDLRKASGPISIGDVAARWGFWHWSRFSGDYQDFFGELPSQTVRRLRP
ncbi:MAG: helix-turn-helix domain-containing protein [Niveispirillum sp.]|uniref:helix-turn-helix domain-containing protein n=1 Tax=Niveispirillum sp. TaxID=1917217 RepID=UPI003BA7AF29